MHKITWYFILCVIFLINQRSANPFFHTLELWIKIFKSVAFFRSCLRYWNRSSKNIPGWSKYKYYVTRSWVILLWQKIDKTRWDLFKGSSKQQRQLFSTASRSHDKYVSAQANKGKYFSSFWRKCSAMPDCESAEAPYWRLFFVTHLRSN